MSTLGKRPFPGTTFVLIGHPCAKLLRCIGNTDTASVQARISDPTEVLEMSIDGTWYRCSWSLLRAAARAEGIREFTWMEVDR